MTYPLLRYRFSSVRARIFLWYVLLLSIFVGISIPLIIRFANGEVNGRVREDFREEVELFQGLLDDEIRAKQKLGLSTETMVKTPTQASDLISIFNVYFANRIPEDDTFLIGIIEQEFYRASPEALIPELMPGTPFLASLKQEVEPKAGIESRPNSSTGDILYQVLPIRAADQSIIGRFVVAHTVAGEQAEALEILQMVFAVLAGVFVFSILGTLWASGQVMKPLEGILATAKQINEKNLAQRTIVKSRGEIADLGHAFNAMMDRLEVSFTSQRHFINDAGHELRTPITIMRGHLELMDVSQLPAEEKDTIPLVLDELERMERLVNDLILLAKAERTDFLKQEVMDIQEFMHELYAKIRGLTARDRVFQFEGNDTGTLTGDRQRLTQAVINLAQNAVQHTQPGDRITLGYTTDRQSLMLWIEDTGEGIIPEEQSRIFERFARVKYTQRKSEGSGLGLAIVKQIVEAHQGTIEVRSQPGRGSTFIITLRLDTRKR